MYYFQLLLYMRGAMQTPSNDSITTRPLVFYATQYDTLVEGFASAIRDERTV